jgi:hypothetical protein
MTHDWHNLFDYKDGNLYWKVDRGTVCKGDEAGYFVAGAIREYRVGYKRVAYPIKQVVAEMHYDDLIEPYRVFHISNNPHDNSIENIYVAV